MTTAAVQTIWADLIAATLARAGVRLCVISPGSRSTPLVAALAKRDDLELVTIIDERAAAFYALGAARTTNAPAVLVCTSGTAAAHYLPAIVEASHADVSLIAITADRPPELQACGASQTIDQRGLYGTFTRGAFDLGTPAPTQIALRALHRTIAQAITLARGPHPGPVHINAPLRKPLEPAAPTTDIERDLARLASELVSARHTPDVDTSPRALAMASAPIAAAPRMVADSAMLDMLARVIASEPDGVIVVGVMPAHFASAREDIFALAVRAGYPIIAEAGSQLRFARRDTSVVCVDHFDLMPPAQMPRAKVCIQIGSEPVAAGWHAWLAHARPDRYVFAGYRWNDPESNANAVILGDVGDAIARVVDILERTLFTSGATVDGRVHSASGTRDASRWRSIADAAARAATHAFEQHPRSETALVRAVLDAMPGGTILQVGNSLPIRVVDHASGTTTDERTDVAEHTVITQRGAAGIDGLIASAAGATHAGKPVLLVLGDVSFVHDLGGLVVARDAAKAPLAILVVDNRGGQIFAGLPIARADVGSAFAEHWLTAPGVDPAAVASALGIRSVTAASASAAASAVANALGEGVTVIHAPVTSSGAHDVRRTAIELLLDPAQQQRRTS